MQSIPRVVIKWLDQLDLTYTVKNARRDLATGFTVAEILSRYFPKEVDMYTYHNGLNMHKRKDNWEQINKVLNDVSFPLGPMQYEAIYNQAKEVANQFLLQLYEFLTKKSLNLDKRPQQEDQEEVKGYQKSTITQLVKDRELTRIVNNKEREQKVLNVINGHKQQMKDEKQDSNIIEYLIYKKKQKQEQIWKAEEEKLLARKQKYQAQEETNYEVKEIQLKSYNSSTSKKTKEQQGQLMEAKGILDFLQDNNTSLLKKEPISKDIAALNLDEKKPGVLNMLFKSCLEVQEESLSNLIDQFLDQSLDLIVDNISTNFLDFKRFFLMFFPILQLKTAENQLFQDVLDLFKIIGYKLSQKDQQSTQLMFENILLKELIEIIKKTSNKCEFICSFFYSFCGELSTHRYHLIVKVKQNIPTDTRLFLHILSILITQNYDTSFDSDLYNIFFENAEFGLTNPSPFTRTRVLKIFNELSLYNGQNILEKFDQINLLIVDNWWEIKAQILIIYSNLLLFLARQDPMQPQLEIPQDDQDNIVKNLLESIYMIFQTKFSENVLLVGLIYLSPVLNYYPQLSEQYVIVLLKVSEGVRKQVLNTNPDKGSEEGFIVQGFASFKYKLTSAPINWNSVSIVQAMDDYVKKNQLESFEKEHLEIILGCLYNTLQDKDAETWIQIYENLKKYIFLSMTEKNLSKLASEILKKIFLFQTIQTQVLENSKSIFSKFLTLVYSPDIDVQCKESLLDFLEFLNEQGDIFIKYTFDIIKDFSEKNTEVFLKSNLVEFMNNLAKDRRRQLHDHITI